MEPSYTEWKPFVNAQNEFVTVYCPYCQDHRAKMMSRYVTNRDGETERQYRVTCPVCERSGKTYLHENIARRSWETCEQDKRMARQMEATKWPRSKSR